MKLHAAVSPAPAAGKTLFAAPRAERGDTNSNGILDYFGRTA